MPATTGTLVDRTNVPAEHAFSITPNDTTDLTHATRALWIGGAGTVVVDMVGGETSVTFSGIAAGTLLPIAVTRVRTSSTATLMVGVY